MTMMRPDAIVIHDDDTLDELLADLAKCARYPHSAQRTASTDTLLDEVLERRSAM